jgi:hypothetical protein
MWDAPGLDISNKTNFYLQLPSISNTVWDALNSSGTGAAGQHYILQHTLLSKQGVRADAITALLNRLDESRRKQFKPVFVVPAENYRGFTYQPWLDAGGCVYEVVPKEVAGMEQWVMALPLPAPFGKRGCAEEAGSKLVHQAIIQAEEEYSRALAVHVHCVYNHHLEQACNNTPQVTLQLQPPSSVNTVLLGACPVRCKKFNLLSKKADVKYSSHFAWITWTCDGAHLCILQQR